LDSQAQIIGVNTSISRVAADGLPITSISFALKSSVARAWLRAQGLNVDYVTAPLAEKPMAQPPAERLPAKSASPPPAPPVGDAPQSLAPKSSPPKAAPPPGERVHTEKRPYDLDGLIRGFAQVERDLTDMADEMRKRTRPR
jgi:serine protease Do